MEYTDGLFETFSSNLYSMSTLNYIYIQFRSDGHNKRGCEIITTKNMKRLVIGDVEVGRAGRKLIQCGLIDILCRSTKFKVPSSQLVNCLY